MRLDEMAAVLLDLFNSSVPLSTPVTPV